MLRKSLLPAVFVLVLCLALLFTSLAYAEQQQQPKPTQADIAAYTQVVQKTVQMVSDQTARQLAQKYGLNILDVTWEDTGRFHNSAVGPNISDMTIQVQVMDPKTEKFSLYCMPVIRYPNFEDKSCDVKLDNFYLLVGNEDGKPLKKVTLRQFLGNMRQYMHTPKSWKGPKNSLLAKRDTHVLCSAQACFLPIPKKGIATFNPVLFNYQSYEKNPAVLTILATREGTSVTVIDNKRDAFAAGATWGQRLFFNQNGKRASLTGKRMSDFLAGKSGKGGKTNAQTMSKQEQEGLNLVLLIQVPLKQKERPRPPSPCGAVFKCESKSAPGAGTRARSDVENAVIGHGKVEGPFTEVDNLPIERDDRFPIRVTIQFYKATSNGVVSVADMASIDKQIQKVYKDADYVGSLVVDTQSQRPTVHSGPKVQPPDWWDNFWKQYEQNTGMTKEQAMEMLRKLRGPGYMPGSEKQLEKDLREIK